MTPAPVVVYDGFVKVLKVGNREVVQSTDSVGILVYDPVSKSLVLVQQKRVPMDIVGHSELLVEVVAGRADKGGIGLVHLVQEELQEEIGASIRTDQVKFVNDGCQLALSPGILTERMTLVYVALEPGQMALGKTFGSPSENEVTYRFLVDVERIDAITYYDMKTWALIQWFKLIRPDLQGER